MSGEEFLERMLDHNYESIIKKFWEGRDSITSNSNPRNLGQLCDALLRAGYVKDAIYFIQYVIDATRPDMRGGDDYDELAAAHWLSGNQEEAIAKLRQGLKCNYGDGAKNMSPALLLYYAAVRTGDDALKQESIDELQEKLATGWAKNWPAPLGRFLIGAAGEDHVQEELANEVPQRQPDERCRFDFYRGVKNLESGNENAAKECYRNAVDHKDQKTWTTEFVLARHELGETPVPTEPLPN